MRTRSEKSSLLEWYEAEVEYLRFLFEYPEIEEERNSGKSRKMKKEVSKNGNERI